MQAKKALVAFQAELDREEVATSGATTFGDYLDKRYLPHVKATKSPETARNVQSRSNRIKADLGGIRLDKLNAGHLDHAYIRWQGELAPNTIRSIHGLISAALSQAVKWALIPRNVAPLATVPPATYREDTTPTLAQITALVDATADRDPVLSAAIMLAALTGARRGELLALRWSDVDRNRMVIRVARSVKRGDDLKPVVGATKTRQIRLLSIDNLTLAVIDAQRRRCEEWTNAAGLTLDDGYILTYDPSGQSPSSADVLTHRFARVVKSVGCGGVRFHDLRHAVATTLLSQGYDLAVVGGRLGHSSPVVTMRVYAHALEGRDRQAAGVMGALLTSTK